MATFELHLNAPDTDETRAALERAGLTLFAELTTAGVAADATLLHTGNPLTEWDNRPILAGLPEHTHDDSDTDDGQDDPVPDRLNRAQILDRYCHDLPEEMGDGPFTIYTGIDDGLPGPACTVASNGDCVFCLTCEAQGYLDGHDPNRDGVEQWHRNL